MREGVTVHNLKTKMNLNSEFGGPNTVEERGRCARGWPCLGHPVGSPWDPRPEQPFVPMGHTRPTQECDVAASDSVEASLLEILLKPSSFPPFLTT